MLALRMLRREVQFAVDFLKKLIGNILSRRQFIVIKYFEDILLSKRMKEVAHFSRRRLTDSLNSSAAIMMDGSSSVCLRRSSSSRSTISQSSEMDWLNVQTKDALSDSGRERASFSTSVNAVDATSIIQDNGGMLSVNGGRRYLPIRSSQASSSLLH